MRKPRDLMPVHAVPIDLAAVVVQAPAQSLYARAVADRLDGRFEAALAGFQEILGAEPRNLDARLNLGLTLLALGRLDDADKAFETVLATAPDYVDARLGLVQVAQRRGDTAAARRHLAQARIQAPDRDDIPALSTVSATPLWRLDFDVSRSRLSGDLPDWSSERLAGTRRLGDHTTAGLSVERTTRFGTEDVYLEAQIDQRFGWASGYLAIGGTPRADYRPEQSLRLGGRMPLTARVEATIDTGLAHYATGTVWNVQPGLTATLASDRLVLAARWIQVWDEQHVSRSGYAARASVFLTDRSRLSLTYADAPETSEGVTVDVRSTGVGLDFDLTANVAARLSLVQEDRGSYDRNEFAFGIGVRF